MKNEMTRFILNTTRVRAQKQDFQGLNFEEQAPA